MPPLRKRFSQRISRLCNARSPIDKQGVRRLLQALDKAPVWQFKVLAFGRASDPIAGSDLRTLLQAIAAKPQGFPVAAEILDMRLFSDGDKKDSGRLGVARRRA